MRKTYLAVFASILCCSAFAQKMPAQKGNLAPAGIRIDGNINEWTSLPFTENKRTNLDYALANDDKNLYLIVKAKESATINKIMMGGISFTVNIDGKKKEKEVPSITYPLIKRAGRGGGQGGSNRSAFGGGQNRTETTAKQRDSIALALHKTQIETVKEIKVLDFKGIQDTLISIYNEYSIKTVASFDDAGLFTYELAVPLAKLGLKKDDTRELAYQIKLNGLTMGSFGGGNRGGGGGNGGGGNRGGGGGFQSSGGFRGGTDFQDLMSPTDFWDKYTLFKK
ncbi:hypothetical protein [Pedobacter sp. MW01-1-1]|uniref:hypothetical protein n=1 Tax=Pedobacter sp. MW01-1-1 TaxID=3383027 RepID=UPI003FEF8138